MDLKSAHSQESGFQESGEVDRFLKMGTKWVPIFKRDRALWKMAFVLHGQAFFGYAQGICVAFDTCCSGANI